LFSEFDINLFLNYFNNNYKKLKNKIFFITGATGFIGKWLLGALLLANDKFFLNLKIFILSRNPQAFKISNKYIGNHSSVTFIEGDIRKKIVMYPQIDLPKEIDYLIHAANDITSNISPIEILDVCINGTKNIINFAKLKKVKDFLLISSGAVYGIQPSDIQLLNENYNGTINFEDSNSLAYGLGKINSEFLVKEYSKKKFFNSKIARCFSFVGPFMAMDKHFAIGNFIRDAAEGNNINISSDGSSIRTYLYAGELSVWLLEILINSKGDSIYNVGGSEPISILNLAKRVANLINPKLSVTINNSNNLSKKSNIYIPDINHIKNELNLTPTIKLDESIIKTYEWYLASK
tara:strand:- start:18842 stop:19888 length:1047 start_codon:yes stop_codon:yes gene_type:complete